MRALKLLARIALLALLAGVAAVPARAAEAEAKILAPSGTLRVGLYPGTPTSILPDAAGGPRGVGYELGKALAARLGVPFEAVVFAKNAEVLAALKSGQVDAIFTNASAARAKEMDFGPVYMDIELGYLVAKDSRLAGVGDVDRAGVRVGVTAGSTSDATLSRDLKGAEIVRAETIGAGVDLLAAGRIDAFATNKATLFELAEKLQGSRVLDGKWGAERHAIAVPKGREQGHAFLREFTDSVKREALVEAAIARAGLKGAVVPE